jgi:large subunit ribosomal protein L5
MGTRLKDRYTSEVVPALMKRFGYTNRLEVPALEKIVVNVGVGEAIQNPKLLEGVAEDLRTITGQKPSIRRAKKSISSFKLRAGMAIGCKVTLRRDRMYEFLDRLLTFGIPRIRDFRGVSPDSFDGRGNYTLGLQEQIIFPEIDFDKIEKIHGMDITLVTTAKTDEEGSQLLRELGMPFRAS